MWFRKKKEELKPGKCECGHARCFHKKGKGHCVIEFPPGKNGWENGSICACVCYIRKDNEDDDSGSIAPETPTPSELERLYNR